MPKDIRTVTFPYTVSITFPGDLDYIPAIRKFVSEMLQVSNFEDKFAYRSEIIVDEICNNAVSYGCRTSDAAVELTCTIFDDRIEFDIKDQGGTKENIDRLRDSLVFTKQNTGVDERHSLGIEIVRMLSEEIQFQVDEQNVTSIHIVRKREETE